MCDIFFLCEEKLDYGEKRFCPGVYHRPLTKLTNTAGHHRQKGFSHLNFVSYQNVKYKLFFVL